MDKNSNKREKRHEKIRNLLLANELVTVGEFCKILNCSEATIRNDLRYLEEAGIIKRNFGGAVATGNIAHNSNLAVRISSFKEEKSAIARYVIENLLVSGQTIILDSGSTCLELAQKIIESDLELTVLTNSFSSAAVLTKSPKINIYLAGGRYDPITSAFHDEITRSVIKTLRADIFFMAPNGISADAGFTTPSPDEAIIKQFFINCTRQCFALADHSKFGKMGFKVVCGFDKVVKIISDSRLNINEVEKLKKSGVDIIIAQI